MKIDYKDHYDAAYWTGEKTFVDEHGKIQKYHGPSLEWDGFETIARIIQKCFGKSRETMGSVLDIGCGGGDLVSRLTSSPYGVEISEHAIRNCVPAMRDRIALADITHEPKTLASPWFDAERAWDTLLPLDYDFVISTDLMEHIYESDLHGTFNWMMCRARRFMFLLVATMPDGEREFVHTKGAIVPPEYEQTAVSGHINVRNWRYWAKFFREQGCDIRWDLMWNFHREVRQHEWLRDMEAWGHSNVWILEV